MTSRNRRILIGAGSVVALILIVIVAVPLFLNADSFRTRIELTLTDALGRKVAMGKLSLSVWSGSLVAQNATVADDPRFSTQPFLQASSIKINVAVLPLIFSREVRIEGFRLDAPKISLLRAADGTWNYSTIGSNSAKTPANPNDDSGMIPDLTVGHVDVNDGLLTVANLPAAGVQSTPVRVYDNLNLDVRRFSFGKQFPYSASANLPGGGTVSIVGNAGPVNPKDASLTPFSAHLELKHLDPLAAGFVDAATGITGTIDTLNTDALWNGRQLQITNLLIDTPKLTLASTYIPSKGAATAKPAAAASTGMIDNFSLDRLEVKNGAITLATAGRPSPALYQQLNATITNFSSKTAAPFTLSTQIPGGGALSATGTAGPLNQQDATATPFNAKASLKTVHLASSGLLAPDVGVGGIANVDVKAISNGQTVNATGTAHVEGIRLAKNGTPSPKAVDATFTLTQNMQSLAGTIQSATLTVGKAAVNIAGTYQSSGPTTALNFKVNGQSLSIEEIKAFLPALGVQLPTGSSLQGGTLTASVNVTGSSANPVISGPVSIDNTQLTGFDLSSKLAALNALTGARTGSATVIRSLRMNLRVDGGNIRTDSVSLVMPALGSATGNGTVSAGGALNYQMLLKLTVLGGGSGGGATTSAGGIAGQLMGFIPGSSGGGGIAGGALKRGIPVAIAGTTSNPTFAPDMTSLITSGGIGAAKGILGGTKQQRQASPGSQLGDALGGLLKQKKN